MRSLRNSAGTSGIGRPATLATLLAISMVAGGCAMKRDSVVVGAIPDDYRTNHPIVVSEREKVIDIPVGMSDRGLNRVQKVAVNGFVADYDRKAGSLVTIMIPSGSPNAVAAQIVARDAAHLMYHRGVPSGRIATVPYDPGVYDQPAPIRISYARMTASTGKCGRWPADLGNHSENKHWANFGCSYQNNLAAQIANPADLLGPRAPSEIDAENRSAVIEDYQLRGVAETFRSSSEVDY